MKASLFEEYGGPEVLSYTDFPVPQPRRGEALVKVHAVSLNGYDLMARAGRYKPNKGKFPHILGGDFGGELAALGETTCDLPLGTRVPVVEFCPVTAANNVWPATTIVVHATTDTSGRMNTGLMQNTLGCRPTI